MASSATNHFFLRNGYQEMHIQQSLLEAVPCGICGSNQFRDLFRARDYVYGIKGEWPVVQCVNCGVVLLNPRIPHAHIGDVYPGDYYTNEPTIDVEKRTWRRVAKDIVLEHCFGYKFSDNHPLHYRLLGWSILPFTSRWAIARKFIYPAKSMRVLDIGCGNGQMLSEYKHLGWKTYGLEVNPTAAKFAQQTGHEVFIGVLDDANYPNDYFTAVTLWDSLEHIHNPGEIVRKICRITEPGGRIYVSVPNYGSWYGRTLRDKWFMFTAPLHYYHYTQTTLTKLLTQSGFGDIQIRFPLGDAGLRYTLKGVWRDRRILSKIPDTFFVNWLLAGIDLLAPGGHLFAVAVKQ